MTNILFPSKHVLLFLLVFFSFKISSQNKDSLTSKTKQKPNFGSWSGDNKIISLGVGNPVLDPFYLDRDEINATNTSTFSNQKDYLVIHAKGELGIANHFGVGITVNGSKNQYNETYIYTNGNGINTSTTSLVTLKVLTVNFRVNYHLLNSKLIDPYFGIGAGLKKVTANIPEGKVSVFEARKPFGFEATFGLRVLIGSLAGVYIEGGLGRSLIQAGISINLNRKSKEFF